MNEVRIGFSAINARLYADPLRVALDVSSNQEPLNLKEFVKVAFIALDNLN